MRQRRLPVQKQPQTVIPEISNKLLAALPARDYKRLSPHLEPIPLELKAVLHEVGAAVRYVRREYERVVG